MAGSTSCPSDNTQAVDQSTFWSSDGANWDTHRIGWAISGSCALATVVISLVSVMQHCLHYTNPAEQRQVLRILYMPPVYAIISFFSYRYFRAYTYYDLIETAYESITLSAFLLLLIEYVATTAVEHDVKNAIARKDKQSLPIPFCCWRYRPTKAYFMYALKWSVLQYVIIRPLLSIIGIIAQAAGVLCESGSWSWKTAKAYITVIDGVSISVALYGLFLFYGLTKEELKGRRPLAKFMAIKLIVMFTFYQSLIFTALEGHAIHATQYWTEANIADGINALAICIEMVFFSLFMMWAYTWKEYTIPGESRTRIVRPLWDSINYSDFFVEVMGSTKYFVDRWRNRKGARRLRAMVMDENGKQHPRMNFEEAFGFSGYQTQEANESDLRLRGSYDENIRLAPYTYSGERSGALTPVTTFGGDGPDGMLGMPRPPKYTAGVNEVGDTSLEELRRVHVHSPDPAELKRLDGDSDYNDYKT